MRGKPENSESRAYYSSPRTLTQLQKDRSYESEEKGIYRCSLANAGRGQRGPQHKGVTQYWRR